MTHGQRMLHKSFSKLLIIYKRRIGIVKVLTQDEDTGDLQIPLHLRLFF